MQVPEVLALGATHKGIVLLNFAEDGEALPSGRDDVLLMLVELRVLAREGGKHVHRRVLWAGLVHRIRDEGLLGWGAAAPSIQTPGLRV